MNKIKITLNGTDTNVPSKKEDPVETPTPNNPEFPSKGGPKRSNDIPWDMEHKS